MRIVVITIALFGVFMSLMALSVFLKGESIQKKCSSGPEGGCKCGSKPKAGAGGCDKH